MTSQENEGTNKMMVANLDELEELEEIGRVGKSKSDFW